MSFSIANENPAPPQSPRITPAVQWVIAATAAIFFLQLVSPAGAADMQRLLGFSANSVGERWWTPVTYLLVHGGFWHLALNMYALALFGPRVERAWSGGEFTRYYVVCGVGGLLLHLLLFRDSPLVGASSAVYGVMLAYARRWPDADVYLFSVVPVKVKWLVALLVVMTLVSGLGSADGVGVAHLAHLGGFATGWIYLRVIEAAGGPGGSGGLRPRVASIPDVPDETPRAIPRGLPRARERGDETDEIVAKSKAAIANQPSRPVRRRVAAARPPAEADLDSVLDKIARQGLASLTMEERRVLEEASRRLRDE